MLGKEKLMAFVATASPKASREFYERTLELTNTEDSLFALEFVSNSVKFRVQKVESVTPQPYTVLGWEVENIVITVRHLIDKGIDFQQFDNLPQDELGIWTTPDNAKVAWFKDPDGNTISLTQRP